MLPKLFGKYGSAKSLVGARSMQAIRGTGRGIRGVGRLGWRATKGVAGAVALSSGFAPVIAAASGLGRGLFGSRRGGRSRGRSRGGGSSESETGLLNTSLLFQIRDEVAQIKGLLVTQQIPESERREREFEEWRRHRELLSAISALSLGGIGGAGGKKDGGSLAKLLLGLLALTGLAMLPKLLENIPSIVDGIQSFLDKMALFLMGMWGAFKLLSKRAKAMKPPKPKAMKGPSRGKGRAAFIKRLKAARALRLKRTAEKGRLKAKTAATNKIKAAEKAARAAGRLGGARIPPEKATPEKASAKPPKARIGSRIGNWFAETEGKSRAVAEGKQAAERRAGRTIGGKTIGPERGGGKTSKVGIGSRIGAFFADTETRGKGRAVTEAKQAAERAAQQKAQRLANQKATADRIKARLTILNAEKAQLNAEKARLLEEQRANDKRRQGFDEDRKRTRAKILRTRAQQIARTQARALQLGIKGGDGVPDTKKQDKEALRRERINLARLKALSQVKGLSAKFTGKLSTIYNGLRLANINMHLLVTSIQKGMGGISPERGPGVGGGSPKVTSSTAATSFNEVNRGSIRTGAPRPIGSMTWAPMEMERPGRKIGSLGGIATEKGAGIRSGTVQPGSQQSIKYSFVNKGPSMGGSGITTTATAAAAGESRLKQFSEKMSRFISGLGGKFKKFASAFWGHLKSGMQSTGKLASIPGVPLLGKLLIIIHLVTEIGSLLWRYMNAPETFKGKTDWERGISFGIEIAIVVAKLMGLIALFVTIGTLVGAALAFALPSLAGGLVIGLLAGVASYFISSWLIELFKTQDPNKASAKYGDPYQWWKAQNEKAFDTSFGMIGEGWMEKNPLQVLAGVVVAGATSVSHGVQKGVEFATKDRGVTDAVRKAVFADSNFIQASTAGGGGASASGIHPTALGNEKLRILMKKAEAKLTDDVKKIVPEVLPSYVLGATMATGDSSGIGYSPGMADGSLIHPSALDHEKLRWIMAQYKSSPEVVLVTSSQYIDASKKSHSRSSVTSVNSNAGSNVSYGGQGFYE